MCAGTYERMHASNTLYVCRPSLLSITHPYNSSQIPEPEVAVRGVAISRDGSLLSAVNSEGNCFIWSMQDGECTPLRKIAVHEGAYAISCKFSPDNRFLCTTSSDMTAKLWDADRDFDLAHTLTGHTAWVWGCAFSGDSNYVITGMYRQPTVASWHHLTLRQSRPTTPGPSGTLTAASAWWS